MTRKQITTVFAAMIGALAISGAAGASELRTWYIYCEGTVNGHPSAIFSANFWPHENGSTYQRSLAAAAEAYIRRSPNTELSGCAGIPFLDQTIAEHNRARTAELARGIGDAVYYVDMPATVLPD